MRSVTLHDAPVRDDERASRLAAGGTTQTSEFDLLYGEMVPRVHGLVRRLVADPELRADIVQETFVRAYVKGLHEEEGRGQWPWLAAVARNLALDVLRRQRTFSDEPIDGDEPPATRRSADPAAELAVASERRVVAEVLVELTPQQRRMLLLCHLEGCSYEELANREGMSLEAVRSSLARARRRFRRRYVAVSERRSRPPEPGSTAGVLPGTGAGGAGNRQGRRDDWRFEQFIEAHVRSVRGVVTDLLGDTPVAREVVKETFRRARREGLHRVGAGGPGTRSAWPWLATTARNLALEVARSRSHPASSRDFSVRA